MAVFTNLPEGRYTVEVEFPGFEKGVTRDVRVRQGENRQSVVLALQKQEDTVTVRQDAQAAAADPRGRFGSALTREQIEALSDDPQEMRRQLAEMVGGDAVIRVDTFEGAQLPPKSQIRSIRVSATRSPRSSTRRAASSSTSSRSLAWAPARRHADAAAGRRAERAQSVHEGVKGPERTGLSVLPGGALIRDRLGSTST